jgi:hypothetical protein
LSANYRQALEAQDFERLPATLAEDAVLLSPIGPTAHEGREKVVGVLRAAVGILQDFRCKLVIEGDELDVVLFGGRVEDGPEVEFIDLVRTGSDGLVQEITVVGRPAKAVFRWAQAAAAGEGRPPVQAW